MKVGFIGCGNMGAALITAIAKDKQTKLYIFDTNKEKAEGIASVSGAEIMSAEDIVKAVDILFLAVKPNVISAVLSSLSEAMSQNPELTVISMAAGVKLAALEEVAPGAKLIRIMPNTSVAVGSGVTAYATGGNVTEADEAAFLDVMKFTGICDKIPEGLIDAESAIAGSGPAFAYMFIDALADGGVLCGLPRDKAITYAAAMLEGAAKTLLKTGEHPSVLKDRVCSPGGSTIEGVAALEAGGFRAALTSAVLATCEKAKKLGK